MAPLATVAPGPALRAPAEPAAQGGGSADVCNAGVSTSINKQRQVETQSIWLGVVIGLSVAIDRGGGSMRPLKGMLYPHLSRPRKIWSNTFPKLKIFLLEIIST